MYSERRKPTKRKTNKEKKMYSGRRKTNKKEDEYREKKCIRRKFAEDRKWRNISWWISAVNKYHYDGYAVRVAVFIYAIDDATKKILLRNHTIGFNPFRGRLKMRTTNSFYTIKA